MNLLRHCTHPTVTKSTGVTYETENNNTDDDDDDDDLFHSFTPQVFAKTT